MVFRVAVIAYLAFPVAVAVDPLGPDRLPGVRAVARPELGRAAGFRVVFPGDAFVPGGVPWLITGMDTGLHQHAIGARLDGLKRAGGLVQAERFDAAINRFFRAAKTPSQRRRVGAGRVLG